MIVFCDEFCGDLDFKKVCVCGGDGVTPETPYISFDLFYCPIQEYIYGLGVGIFTI